MRTGLKIFSKPKEGSIKKQVRREMVKIQREISRLKGTAAPKDAGQVAGNMAALEKKINALESDVASAISALKDIAEALTKKGKASLSEETLEFLNL